MSTDRKKKGNVEVRVEPESGRTTFDVEALRQIVEILEASEVTSLVWRNGREKLYVRRGQPVTQVVQQLPVMPVATPGVHVVPAQAHPPAPVLAPAAGELRPRPSAPARASATTTEAGDKKGHLITSPFVGTFYRNPSPDQPPYVEVGSLVKKGQVLCIVEAMKLMNEIESEVAGKVSEVLVQNAQPVEFGQALFPIEPA